MHGKVMSPHPCIDVLLWKLNTLGVGCFGDSHFAGALCYICWQFDPSCSFTFRFETSLLWEICIYRSSHAWSQFGLMPLKFRKFVFPIAHASTFCSAIFFSVVSYFLSKIQLLILPMFFTIYKLSDESYICRKWRDRIKNCIFATLPGVCLLILTRLLN